MKALLSQLRNSASWNAMVMHGACELLSPEQQREMFGTRYMTPNGSITLAS